MRPLALRPRVDVLQVVREVHRLQLVVHKLANVPREVVVAERSLVIIRSQPFADIRIHRIGGRSQTIKISRSSPRPPVRSMQPNKISDSAVITSSRRFN